MNEMLASMFIVVDNLYDVGVDHLVPPCSSSIPDDVESPSWILVMSWSVVVAVHSVVYRSTVSCSRGRWFKGP